MPRAARGSSSGASRWRARSAPSFRDWEYWGRPIPGFGDPAARVLLLGLAPAAHGANRTGRVFTGDRSGDFLFAALHRDGLREPADVRARATTGSSCATAGSPPRCAARRRPTSRCRRSATTARPGWSASWRCSRAPRVVVCLGAFAWEAALRTPALLDGPVPRPRPRFGHGAEHGARCSAASTRASRTRSPASSPRR